MRPLYIFDLDGTLALNGHREYLVQGEHKNWQAFFRACVDDAPNYPVIKTFHLLQRLGSIDIVVWSGRSDEVEKETRDWLDDNEIFPDSLLMRRAGDFTPDEVLKRKWYEELGSHDKARLVAVFDDRDKVVAMWRSIGVACFQVAPGKF